MRDRLRVLVLASDPFRDGAQRRLVDEARAIEAGLRGARARRRVQMVAEVAVRTRDLQHALMRHDPRIVHVSGPGDGPGGIRLGDARGVPWPVSGHALGAFFGALSSWIRVVILNGCDTLPAVDVLGEAVDYAIGMDRPLADPSAVVFARAFYGAVAMGTPVQASFDAAVGEMELVADLEAGTPVLRIRPGVDPAVPLLSSRRLQRCRPA